MHFRVIFVSSDVITDEGCYRRKSLWLYLGSLVSGRARSRGRRSLRNTLYPYFRNKTCASVWSATDRFSPHSVNRADLGNTLVDFFSFGASFWSWILSSCCFLTCVCSSSAVFICLSRSSMRNLCTASCFVSKALRTVSGQKLTNKG